MMLRTATEADREAVFALGVLEEVVWFGEAAVSAEEVGEWVADEGGMARGVVAVDDGGRVAGFVSPGRHRGVFLADPARIDAVADTLLPSLRDAHDAREVMTFAGDRQRLAAFERHGLRHSRSSFTLVRPGSSDPVAAPAFPDGVRVAPYRPGVEDEAAHQLIYRDAAWASVPGHVARDLAEWRAVMRHCSSVFLARRDGRPVGWIAGRVLASGRGYVDMLAVAMSERRRGLGRALLLHAFADLQLAGAGDLTLGVEAENDSALSLYRSVDLEIEREWRILATR